MIKDTELRKGSRCFVEGHGETEFKVLQIKTAEADVSGGPSFHVPFSDLRPIPLTTEILERYGFVNKKDEYGEYVLWLSLNFAGVLATLRYYPSNDVKAVALYTGKKTSGVNIIGRLYYNLHQIQNLYFTLTGEELTIKEPALV